MDQFSPFPSPLLDSQGWIEIDDEDVAQCHGLADEREGEVEEGSAKWM